MATKTKIPFTVIGYDDTDGIAKTAVVEAEDHYAAIKAVAKKWHKEDQKGNDESESWVVCVIPGKHQPLFCSEENQNIASAEDLAE